MVKDYDYSKYWENEYESRKKYYQELYGKINNFYKFPENKTVLDIGGGNGQLSNFFKIKKAVIMDISDSGLNFAKKKFGYRVLKQDLGGEWGIGKQFNVALCNECLEHFESPLEVMKKANDSLKIDGILYVSVPNMMPDGEHHKAWMYYQKLAKICKESGFKIEKRIIIPRFAKNTKAIGLKQNVYNFISFILGKSRGVLTEKFPSIFGKFYHLKLKKIKNLK